jgi:hypothetical protein
LKSTLQLPKNGISAALQQAGKENARASAGHFKITMGKKDPPEDIEMTMTQQKGLVTF